MVLQSLSLHRRRWRAEHCRRRVRDRGTLVGSIIQHPDPPVTDAPRLPFAQVEPLAPVLPPVVRLAWAPRADDMRDVRNTNRPLMLLVERNGGLSVTSDERRRGRR